MSKLGRILSLEKFIKEMYSPSVSPEGELQDFHFSDIQHYPLEEIRGFVLWFKKKHNDTMNAQGWTIKLANTSTITDSDESYDSKRVFHVEYLPTADIDGTEEHCYLLAMKLGLKLDNNGIVVGFDDMSFVKVPKKIKVG